MAGWAHPKCSRILLLFSLLLFCPFTTTLLFCHADPGNGLLAGPAATLGRALDWFYVLDRFVQTRLQLLEYLEKIANYPIDP